ncbi:MAG: beta-ketoacyl-ACP reductase [Candidatus Faecousia sp.]|jgi:3-oxoacyl-[acyl-carrier protein] reductase|uniref:beta-ketoacyl-ACP reductase n=1 Tax=Faecousia sp. TaxID=2952921 RepID=UPI002A8EBB4E|nr:beta-ketoacyl-ACP reductase [Candidatus Faecousia sp.]
MKLFEEGTIALVTGGSAGIGRAVAIDLAAKGATVVINYNRSREGAEETLNVIREAGGKAAIVKADVSDPDEVDAMFAKIKKHFKKLDILVNNSGVTRDGYLMMMSREAFDTVIKTNLYGCYYCTQGAIRLMCAAKNGGAIVNISSTSGVVGQEGQANYSASKGAIVSFTKTVAKEYARHGIRANVVAPGFIDTRMTQANRKLLEEKYMQYIPMGRFGEPQEIANVVTFLASDLASYITGKTIVADGGLIM